MYTRDSAKGYFYPKHLAVSIKMPNFAPAFYENTTFGKRLWRNW